jgi:exodeoxyribonuclease-1
METFLFYDLETTGLSKPFDQILQFAGIRTDKNLHEIERYELKVKLNPDVIPSPYALMTHHIDPHDGDISEYDAIRQIHSWMNQPGTLSLGYNTLGFDDEFLRFSFFRNLLPPYTHQFANNCGRMDLYPMAIMYYLFKNHLIQWPEVENKVSLKLELINNANNLARGRAHDAMVDVLATLQLARHFYKESDMWNYLAGHFNKAIDNQRTEPLQKHMALLFEGFLGAENKYHCPVRFIGQHRHYKNQTLWLRLDMESLPTTTLETLTETTRIMNKKPGEPGFVLPMKERFLQHLSPERLKLAEYNDQWLAKNPDMLFAITEYYTEFKYPTYPHTDIDASLYLTGFKNSMEERFCQSFHAANPAAKASMVEKSQNSLIRKQAIRILGRHFPEVLTSKQKDEFNLYMASINPAHEEDAMIDFQNKKRLTPRTALQQMDEIRKNNPLSEEQRGLLLKLELYLKNAGLFSGR